MDRKQYEYVKANYIKIGDRIFSKWIGECFTVREIRYSGDYVNLIEDSFSMKAKLSSNIKREVNK